MEVAQRQLIEAESGELDDVATRRKLTARTTDDHHARCLGLGHRLQHIEDAAKFAPHRDVECIAFAGVGELDSGKRAVHLKADRSTHAGILTLDHRSWARRRGPRVPPEAR